MAPESVCLCGSYANNAFVGDPFRAFPRCFDEAGSRPSTVLWAPYCQGFGAAFGNSKNRYMGPGFVSLNTEYGSLRPAYSPALARPSLQALSLSALKASFIAVDTNAPNASSALGLTPSTTRRLSKFLQTM